MTTLSSRARALSVWEQFIGGYGLTLALAAFVALSVALPIQQANWVRGMPPLVIVAALGGSTGYLLYRAGWPQRLVHLTGAGAGVLLAAAVGAAVTPGAGPADRVVELFAEVADWLAAIPTDEVRGGLAEFAMFLTLVVWLVSYLGVWLALRHVHGWATVLLGGVVLAFVLGNIAGGAGWWLGVFMAASVMLIIRLSTVRRMLGWRARATVFDPQTVLAHSGIILAFGLGVALFAAALPSPGLAPLGAAAQRLEDATQIIERNFSRLFNGLPSRRSYQTIVFDDATQFRGNPNLTDKPLFTVSGGAPTYWRARTYTTYASSGWETVETELLPFETALETDDLYRVPDTHTFKVVAATDTLFSGGLPAAFDEPAEAMASGGALSDVLQVRFSEGRDFFPTRVNLNYTSTGTESFATAGQLREAGGDYPRWIEETYLQLPSTLPERVRALAEALAGNQENAYDKAIAIRNFVVRTPYNLDIPAPPSDADGVDYFLFDLREGYCDYYASSAVVLLRAAGVPARYVLGYATGRFDEARGIYQVLDLHYHAWAEAYFPEYGWVPFEATPPNAIEFGGDSVGPPSPLTEELDLDDLGEILEDEDEEEFFAFDLGPQRGMSPWIVGFLLFLLGLAVISPAAVWHRWWWRLGRLSRADELYAKMSRLGFLLGMPPRPEQTPSEYAAALADEVPGHSREIGQITRAYLFRRYAPGRVRLDYLRDAERSWSSLRWALLRRLFRVRPA